MLDLDTDAYKHLPEDTPKTPLSHLSSKVRHIKVRTPETSPVMRKVHEQAALAQHSSRSWEHYTPDGEFNETPNYVSMIRAVFGGKIDTDPASCWLAQKTISASWWWGLGADGTLDDGLAKKWYGRTYLNPPGGDTCLVRPELKNISRSYPVVWWLKLCAEYLAGRVTEAVYMGFSLEQMVTTQREVVDAPSILDFPFCVPSKRIPFNYPLDTLDGKPLATTEIKSGGQPSHGNVIVYLPPQRTRSDNTISGSAQRESGIRRFRETFESVGKVVIP